MSTSQPFPIQASLPASTSSTPSDNVSADSKGGFRGVLRDEIDSSLETQRIEDVDVEQVTSQTLPPDGKVLPLVIAVPSPVTETALLETVNTAEDILLAVENGTLPPPGHVLTGTSEDSSLSPLAFLARADSAALIRPGSGITSQPGQLLQRVKAEGSELASTLLALGESGVDAKTQAVTQFKESLQLQSLVSPLTRHAEASVGIAETGRVLEQFSELNQKLQPSAPAASSSTLSPVTPLSQTSQSTTPVAQISVDVPVADSRWEKAFAQRVVWSVGNVQSAQLRINPAELGRIDIQVNLDNDKANVVFTTQHTAVKDAIDQALPRLRDMLSDQGVELDNVDIFQEKPNQQQAGSNSDSSQHAHTSTSNAAIESQTDETESLITHHVSFTDDVVDYYV